MARLTLLSHFVLGAPLFVGVLDFLRGDRFGRGQCIRIKDHIFDFDLLRHLESGPVCLIKGLDALG